MTRLARATTRVVALKHPAFVQRFLACANYYCRPLAKVIRSLKEERQLVRTSELRSLKGKSF